MRKRVIMTILLSLVMVMAFMPAVFADDSENIASGTCGTCNWIIDADGHMTISAGTLEAWEYEPPWYEYAKDITSIEATGPVVVKTAQCMFATPAYEDSEECKLTSLDLTNFDTSQVTNMTEMFKCNTNLKYIDLTKLDTSNVTDMFGMFYGCKNLPLDNLDFSKFDTSNVEKMTWMFSNCKNFKNIDLSQLDYSNVQNMDYMFTDCHSLESVRLQGNAPKLQSANHMFEQCYKLKSVDMSGLITTKTFWGTQEMFRLCSSLTDVSFGGTFAPGFAASMFNGCSALTGIGSIKNLDTSRAFNMERMFCDCTGFKTIDLSSIDTSSAENMADIFAWITPDKLITGPKWDLSKITDNKYPTFPVDMKAASGLEYEAGSSIPNTPGVAYSRIDHEETPGYMNLEDATAYLSGTSYKYTGKKITPAVKVVYDDEELTNGTDYEVSYTNNINVGTGVVTITGMGNYTGTLNTTFEIIKTANTMTARGNKVTIKANAVRKKNQTIKRTKAYTINRAKGTVTYKLSSVTKAKYRKYFKVNAKTGKITVIKRLRKGTYKLKVRISAAGNSNYKPAAKYVAVVVKVK